MGVPRLRLCEQLSMSAVLLRVDENYGGSVTEGNDMALTSSTKTRQGFIPLCQKDAYTIEHPQITSTLSCLYGFNALSQLAAQ